MLSRLVIASLPRSKHLLISWLHHEITICSDFGAQENKVCHHFHCFLIFCHEVMRPDAIILVFWMLSFKPAFSVSSFNLIKRLFSSSFKHFEHYLASMWNEHNCVVVWTFFGSTMKTDFTSPVATAEFSKFTGILNAALSQHHLLGLEIAQLEFHHLH